MARRGKRSSMTRKVLRVPQGAVNTALGMVTTTGKGATRIVKRTGKGAIGITGSAIGTARNVSKTAVNTAGKVTIRATKGVTRLVKNTINLASNLTSGTLKGIRGRTMRRRR